MKEVNFGSASRIWHTQHLPFPKSIQSTLKNELSFAQRCPFDAILPLAFSENVLGGGALLESNKKHLEAASLYLAYGEWDQASAAARIVTVAFENKLKDNKIDLTENERLEFQHAREVERQARRGKGISLCNYGRWAEAVEVLMQIPPTTELVRALYETDAFEKLSALQEELELTDPLQRAICYYLATDGFHTRPATASSVTVADADGKDRAIGTELHQPKTAVFPSFRSAAPWSFEGSIRALEDLQTHWLVERANNTLACIDMAATLLEEIAQNIGPLPQRSAFRRRLHIAVALLEHDRSRVSRGSSPPSQVITSLHDNSPTNSESSRTDNSESSRCTGNSRKTNAWLQAEAWYLFALFERHMARHSYSLAVCAAARLQHSYRNQIPEEVSLKLLLVSAILAGEGVLASDTLCSLESRFVGCQSQCRSLLAPNNYSCRTLTEIQEISVSLFSRSPPRPKADQQLCSLCGGVVSYWECSCASCGVIFEWCTSTATPIKSIPTRRGEQVTFTSNSVKACSTCERVSQETSLRNCPLCHQPYL